MNERLKSILWTIDNNLTFILIMMIFLCFRCDNGEIAK